MEVSRAHVIFSPYRNYRNKTKDDDEEETAARTNDKEPLNLRFMRSRAEDKEDLRNANARTEHPGPPPPHTTNPTDRLRQTERP